MTDQRQGRRHHESVIEASFERPGGGRTSVAVWDASLGGMFLETDAPLEEGALVSVDIRTADAVVSVDSRVLWSRAAKLAEDQPAGMAVRFIDLPDDVSVALNRALQSGMQEKTILGVGGPSVDTTQIGVAAPAVTQVTPRETQIGVAPPANEAKLTAKPHLVLSDTSLPDAPAAAPKASATKASAAKEAAEPGRLEETSPSRARLSSMADRDSAEPPRKSVFGRLVLFMLLGGAAAGGYLYREKIAEMVAPPPPAGSVTPPAPTSTSSPPPAPTASVAAAVAKDAGAAVEHASVADAGVETDAGVRDAGARDAGVRDAGSQKTHDAGKPAKSTAPKSSAKPPATVDMY